jgi:zinc ribbon protein
MAMRCPNCGNELSVDEAFCGLCGTPVTSPSQPTAMVNPPPSRQGLLSGGYNNTISSPPNTNRSGMLPPADNQSAVRSPGPQQRGGFYQEPTEAMSALPPNQVQQYTIYPQQGYTGAPMPDGYSGAGQYAPQMQPYQGGNYTGTLYPPTQSFPTGQGYGAPPGFTPPPPKQSTHLALIITSICIVLAIITIGAFGTVYLLRNGTSSKTQPTTNATPTSIPTPTTVPSPSPTTTPSPTPSPSPTLIPTPAPDPGFTLCDTTCTSNGFSVEYPSAWSQKTTSDSTGTQFTNPSQLDEFAAFKTPGTTSSTAGQLVNTDLTNNFSSLPGYIAPTPAPSSNATIGGENWYFQTAFYQSNGQAERIEVYATVHQGKAYIIELQALDAQFDAANTQYFERMLARFQFQ